MPGYVVQRELRPTDDQLGVKRRGFVGSIAHGRLCTVMADVLAAHTSPKDRRDDADPLTSIPWLTPVLGSGCLESPSASWIDPDDLGRAVADAVGAFTPAPAGSESWEVIATRFTKSLVENRRRNTATTRGPAPQRSIDVDPLAARLVLIAALLTRFCHVARALGPSAIDRLSDEIVRRPPDLLEVDDPFRLGPTVIEPLQHHVKETTAYIKALETRDPVADAVGELLATIRKGLNANDGATVNLNSVRLVTEAAWYQLIADPDTYQGWSELLLGLILNGGDGPVPFRSRRPRFNRLDDAAGKIRELFERPTKTRWHDLVTAEDAETTIHSAVALVLTNQSAAYRARPKTLPIPLAFVTSFDLELEMALWKQGNPFRVAVPIHIASEHHEKMVELVWVVGDVLPDLGLDEASAYSALTSPTNWQAITERRQVDDGRPVVVRLTGSPLLSYEGLKPGTSQRRQLNEVLQRADVRIDLDKAGVPAVSVDEYLAMQQAEVEIYHALQRPKDGRMKGGPNLSLVFPQGSGAAKSKQMLYWSLFGVPISDAAVRQRMMSLLAMRWIARASDPETDTSLDLEGDDPNAVFSGLSESPAKHDSRVTDEDEMLPRAVVGMAVNFRLDQEEASLLSWLGLTVVHAQVKEFIDDVVDYAEHLSGGPYTQRLTSDGCELMTGSSIGRSA
jgi:hypothetical protein